MAETADLGPAELNLKGIRAGDKNQVRVTLLTDGQPWDTTGAVVSAQARATKSASSAAITATVSAIDVTQGTYNLSWPGDQVRTLLGTNETWTGVWDLQILVSGDTWPQTLMEGTFECELDVTRP